MRLTFRQIAGMVDLSAVYADTDAAEMKALAMMAKRHRCACAYTLRSYNLLLKKFLAGESGVRMGGKVGSPSGGSTTSMKIVEAEKMMDMGCQELDMVMNVGLLWSRRYGGVLDDTGGVVEASGNVAVKAILECHHLPDDVIHRGCGPCIEGGAAFFKTGTGWAPTGATLRKHRADQVLCCRCNLREGCRRFSQSGDAD